MSEWVGRTIGGCEIAEEIGRGGVAVVHRAYQPQLDRSVAIKVLRVAEDTSEEFLARFRREARAIAALRHPNILTVYDYGEEGGIAYIVMEYVPGGSLKSRLTGEPMDWPDVSTLLIPVGRALAYAHSQGIVHRDVKPANILMARPDWPLLADFGLAKLLSARRGITQPGTSLGTPTYLSPEQATGEGADIRSDVYSFGVVIYEMLTGQVPFQSDSPLEAMLRRLQEPPEPPCSLNPEISPQLETVILRAMEREPDARHPTMQALLDDLCRLPESTDQPITPLRREGPERTITARLTEQTGVAGPRLVIAASGITVPVPAGDEALIGRADPRFSQPPDIDLGPHGGAAAGVSRRHARLVRDPDGWLLEDLHSTNGTFLNQARLPPGQPTRLHGGDVVRLGTLALVFAEE